MQTLFYFNNVSQLSDFESFEVKPVSGGHSDAPKQDEEPKFWSVIGTLKEENAEGLQGLQGLQGRQFPVADLPSELYAGLFANLCEQITGKA